MAHNIDELRIKSNPILIYIHKILSLNISEIDIKQLPNKIILHYPNNGNIPTVVIIPSSILTAAYNAAECE